MTACAAAAGSTSHWHGAACANAAKKSASPSLSADMVETLHLMEDVRVAACRLLNEWTDMPLKMLQMPGKLHQFMPCTAENVGDRDLLRIGVRGDWRAAIGPHSHGRFSAAYKSFFKSFSKRFSIC